VRSTVYREDLFDVIDVSFVSIRFRVDSHGFTPWMMRVVGTVLAGSPAFTPFNFMH
jgi:hypothetical protein